MSIFGKYFLPSTHKMLKKFCLLNVEDGKEGTETTYEDLTTRIKLFIWDNLVSISV